MSYDLDPTQLTRVVQCYQREMDARNLLCTILLSGLAQHNVEVDLDAGQTLFLFDYVATLLDEINSIWLRKSGTVGTSLFIVARYTALANVILSLHPKAKAVGPSAAGTFLRLITIVASEAILAVRTWAIWERRWRIFFVIAFFAVAALVPCIAIVTVDVTTTSLGPPIAPYPDFEHCRTLVSKIKSYIVPYVMAITFEFVVFSLSLLKIAQLRSGVAESIRMPFLDAIKKDGILYFTWVVALGLLNIVLVVKTGPQMRFASSQLQANIHSLLSTRLILHLSKLAKKQNVLDSSDSPRDNGFYTTGAEAQFTSMGFALGDGVNNERERDESAWEMQIRAGETRRERPTERDVEEEER